MHPSRRPFPAPIPTAPAGHAPRHAGQRTAAAAAAVVALGVTLLAPTTAAAGPTLGVSKVWSYANSSGFASEVGAWDSRTGSLFVVGGKGIELLDVAGNRVARLDTAAAGFGEINSISIFNGIAAVSFTASGASPSAYASDGSVRFFDTGLFRSSGGSGGYLGAVTVGAVPDMVTWTAEGTRLLVANEGERRVIGGTTFNPPGSVSLITFNASSPALSTVTRIGLESFDGQESALRAAGVRIGAGQSASAALEPEYVALSTDGTRAVVTLQEANALAFIDLASPRVTDIRGLGLKDFALAANRIDPSDRDSTVALRGVPVKGLYQPDAIASYSFAGKSFYVLANEGDAATDDSDIVRFGSSAVTLDPAVFDGVGRPTQAQLKPDAALGRLNIVRNGATGDGSTTAMKEIVTLGARSFSIRADDGSLIYDSGSLLEEAVIAAGLYDDGRSDDKGVEPEGVTLFGLGGRTIAAIGLERTTQGAVALFDVTDPFSVQFMQVIATGSTSQFRVEGITAFEWNGASYLALHNEDPSNNTVLFRLLPEPGSAVLVAAALLALGLARRRTGGRALRP
jgi:hypothetical protein